MGKLIINTNNAPAPIGIYSQAVKFGNMVYISGQIGINPQTNELLTEFTSQVEQMVSNLSALATASGGDLSNIVKLNIYIIDMGNFKLVNDIMAKYFTAPYPARAVVGVRELPKNALIEADAIMVLDK